MVMRFGGLDLNLMVALNALLEECSVTKAADRLNTTQPAMSAALGKLREYFDDELLTRVGRDMVPTAQAECLKRPIAEVLAAIQHAMRTKAGFDPGLSDRVFRIMMSDYMASITMPPLIEVLRRTAPSVQVDIVPSDDSMLTKLERGDIDLTVAPEKFLSPEHPSSVVSEDEYVVVVDKNQDKIGDSISLDQYLEMEHVVVNLSIDRATMFEDWFLEHFGISRKYVVSVPTFSIVPALIVNTKLIATMHRKLAERLSQHFDIRLVAVPDVFPTFREHMQWHRLRDHDPGLAWLREQLTRAAHTPG
jgi:LysR family nod box-dependent transcriptional activator